MFPVFIKLILLYFFVVLIVILTECQVKIYAFGRCLKSLVRFIIAFVSNLF